VKKLVEGLFHSEIEEAVSRYAGRRWRIVSTKGNEQGAMHDAARLNGEGLDVYVKVGGNSFSVDQFRQEALGLKLISTRSGVATPEVIDVLDQGGIAVLIMRAIDTVPLETDKAWATLGRGLAQIHKATWTHCGLETHSYLGIFRQDNRPMDSWPDFYGERRLRVQMKMAVDAGNMSIEDCRPIETLIEKMSTVGGPDQPFSLLHGDPWPGNLLYDGKQLVAIDCSVYYGNREIDLSTVDFFSPVPQALFDAYHEAYPIDPGYKDRKALWQINQWLGHVTLFGKSYLPKLMNAVEPYL
jgi:protein-ribulosamine 3-kinase